MTDQIHNYGFKYTKMRELRKRVWWLQMLLLPRWGKLKAGFEGPVRGGKKRGKGQEGRGTGKKRKRRKGWEKNTPEISFWLRPWLWLLTWRDAKWTTAAVQDYVQLKNKTHHNRLLNDVISDVNSPYNSPCMASPAGQSNQRGLKLSGSFHEEAHLGLS